MVVLARTTGDVVDGQRWRELVEEGHCSNIISLQCCRWGARVFQPRTRHQGHDEASSTGNQKSMPRRALNHTRKPPVWVGAG